MNGYRCTICEEVSYYWASATPHKCEYCGSELVKIEHSENALKNVVFDNDKAVCVLTKELTIL